MTWWALKEVCSNKIVSAEDWHWTVIMLDGHNLLTGDGLSFRALALAKLWWNEMTALETKTRKYCAKWPEQVLNIITDTPISVLSMQMTNIESPFYLPNLWFLKVTVSRRIQECIWKQGNCNFHHKQKPGKHNLGKVVNYFQCFL